MSHLWSGRFDTEPNAAVFDFNASFRFDRRLFEDDCLGSLAWAEALRTAGVLSAADADAIMAGLTDILDRGRADAVFVTGPDETSTRSSNDSSSSASGMRAAGCTPAGRATSRCRSTCVCTSGAARPSCNRALSP